MRKVIIWVYLISLGASSKYYTVHEKETLVPTYSDKVFYKYIVPNGPYTDEDEIEEEDKRFDRTKDPPLKQPLPKPDLQALFSSSPLLNAILLSSNLHIPSKNVPPNHPDLLPINPYIALLLSQYGRYVPIYGAGRGIYAYQATNDYHNNKPFGAYKIYHDNY
uniref:Uncharacterized protein LOC114336667 n=1 Tax=Diabrotica virgifera virgifera TaxID=50390 RepID=A0A6P7GD52_DIAVI